MRIAKIRRGQGRRLGFAAACFLFGAMTIVYAQGRSIGDAVPAFAPTIDAYVETVDTGRLWLDGMLRKAADGRLFNQSS